MSTPQEVADGAYLAAAAVSHKAFAGGPERMQPFWGPHGHNLQETWQALNVAQQLHPELPGPASGDTIAKVLPGMQQRITRVVALRRRAALLASHDVTTLEGACNLARLRSCACRAATLWLSTLPLSQALRMTDIEFMLCIRYLLGMSPAPPNAVGSRCGCGTFIQPHDLDHAMNCTHNAGTWTSRHNIVEKQWREIGSHACVASTRIPRTAPFVRARVAAAPGQTHAGPPSPAPPAPPQPASQVAGPSRGATLPAEPVPVAPPPPPAARAAAAPAPAPAPAADADAEHGAEMGRHAPDAAQAAALPAAAAPGGQDPAGPGEQAAAAQAAALERVCREVAQEKLGDIMFMPPGDPLCIGDVSVVNPCACSYCGRAAREDGGAAV